MVPTSLWDIDADNTNFAGQELSDTNLTQIIVLEQFFIILLLLSSNRFEDCKSYLLLKAIRLYLNSTHLTNNLSNLL